MEKTFKLEPSMNQKSFYGKAVVTEKDGVKTLRSYETDVCKIIDGKLVKLWNGYSATTMKHIQSFCDHYGIENGGKAWWDSLPCDNNEKYRIRVSSPWDSRLLTTTYDKYDDAEKHAETLCRGFWNASVEKN